MALKVDPGCAANGFPVKAKGSLAYQVEADKPSKVIVLHCDWGGRLETATRAKAYRWSRAISNSEVVNEQLVVRKF